MRIVRILLAALLVIFTAGFGLCAAMSLSFVKDAPAVLVITGIAALAALGCFFAARAVLRALDKPPPQ